MTNLWMIFRFTESDTTERLHSLTHSLITDFCKLCNQRKNINCTLKKMDDMSHHQDAKHDQVPPDVMF